MSETSCGNLTGVRLRSTPLRRLQRLRTLFTGLALTAISGGSTLGCDAKSESSADRPEVAQPATPVQAPPKAMTEDDFVKRTEFWRDRVAEDPTVAQSASFATAKNELSRVANEAEDRHLRANASVLLGSLYEARGDRATAIAQYRHASKLVDDDAGAFMALAFALAADGKFKEASEVQKTATKLDFNNLENWLVLGEMLIKSGDKKGGLAAYADYEARRKSLIDGLTLKSKAGKYMVSSEERVACAEALASATDQGTAVALTYAFKSDEDPAVRSTVAAVMGLQRLDVYRPALEAGLKAEKAQEVKESIAWALTEISRDPVKPARPELPPEVKQAVMAAKGAPPPAEAPPAEAKGAPPPAETPPAEAEGAPPPAETPPAGAKGAPPPAEAPEAKPQ